MKRWEMVARALGCTEAYARSECLAFDQNYLSEMDTPPTTNGTCIWVIDEDGVWISTCDQHFQFEDDGPKTNGFKFCPYCGNALVEDADRSGRWR